MASTVVGVLSVNTFMLATLVIQSTVVYNCKRTRSTCTVRKTKLELLCIDIMVLVTHSSYKKRKYDIISVLKSLSAKSSALSIPVGKSDLI